MKTLITNGELVTATERYHADLLIDGEQIALIGQNLAAQVDADRTVDATGKLVLPGGIDVHTHLAMPFGGTVSSDDFYTGHRAAAFGGTTCHIDFALQSKGGSLKEAIDDWQENRARGKAVIDYGFHVAITDLTDDVLEEIGRLHEYGVTSIKLFMAYKDVLQVDDATLFRALTKAAQSNVLTCVHAENGDVIDLLVKQALAAGHTDPYWHILTRPPEAEAEATYRAIQLAAMANAPLYIVHLTERHALEAVRQAKSEGVAVYAETCVQYLYHAAWQIKGYNGSFEAAKYVCSPPFRDEEDQLALWRALRDSTLSVVSTDHCPFNFAGQKELGRDDFSKIPNGVPGIEDRMVLLYNHIEDKKQIADRQRKFNRKFMPEDEEYITLNQFVEITATNPAKLFGLYPRKGTLITGADADVVIWDPALNHIISAKTHHMNVDYNLHEGWELIGKPTQLFSRGRLLVDGDEFFGEPAAGSLSIARGPC